MPELHIPLNSYAGPGTNVQKRWIQRRLHGTNPVDEQARHHDIQYSNLGALRSRGRITQAQLEKGVQNSDKQLLAVAKNNLYGINPLTTTTGQLVTAGILGKIGLQKLNILNKSAFINTSNPNRPYMDENAPVAISDLPQNYLQGGKQKKQDRLKRLKAVLQKS
jgi:hypothetical protein